MRKLLVFFGCNIKNIYVLLLKKITFKIKSGYIVTKNLRINIVSLIL